MLASKRHDMIVEMVNKNGSVLVKELSEKFNVTDDSIRKDLTLLEKKGLLKKTYGGAVKNRVNAHDMYVSQRIGKNTEQKQAIARAALDLIDEGDLIFLDVSTANLEFAKLILEKNINVTIVTNMIDVMLASTGKSDTDIIFVGGKLNRGRDGFVGSLTNSLISNFKFDKAFLGVVGVDILEDSVYTYTAEDGVTKKNIVKASKKKYLMLENRKLSLDGNYKFANLTDFTGVVMDKEPDISNKKLMEEEGVSLIYK